MMGLVGLFWVGIIDRLVRLSRFVDWRRLCRTSRQEKESVHNVAVTLSMPVDLISILIGVVTDDDIDWLSGRFFR